MFYCVVDGIISQCFVHEQIGKRNLFYIDVNTFKSHYLKFVVWKTSKFDFSFECNKVYRSTMFRNNTQLCLLAGLYLVGSIAGFSVLPMNDRLIPRTRARNFDRETAVSASSVESTTVGGFIDTELRAQAMKLHTRSQAPREGRAEEKPAKPYQTTRADYLAFLVDSQHVYKALEEIVNEKEELAMFRNTGLERVAPLEADIEFMTKEYSLSRPEVGKPGLNYADELRRISKEGSVPEFMCHYYNFYFAHTAGGRMIGKQMSAMLLDKKTLEFYKVRIQRETQSFIDAIDIANLEYSALLCCSGMGT